MSSVGPKLKYYRTSLHVIEYYDSIFRIGNKYGFIVVVWLIKPVLINMACMFII